MTPTDEARAALLDYGGFMAKYMRPRYETAVDALIAAVRAEATGDAAWVQSLVQRAVDAEAKLAALERSMDEWLGKLLLAATPAEEEQTWPNPEPFGILTENDDD